MSSILTGSVSPESEVEIYFYFFIFLHDLLCNSSTWRCWGRDLLHAKLSLNHSPIATFSDNFLITSIKNDNSFFHQQMEPDLHYSLSSLHFFLPVPFSLFPSPLPSLQLLAHFHLADILERLVNIKQMVLKLCVLLIMGCAWLSSSTAMCTSIC